VFARTVGDAALLAEIMAGFDQEDPDTRPSARPPLAAVAASEPPLPPRFAFVRTPSWKHAEPATVAAFEELIGELGNAAGEVELGSSFDRAVELHGIVMAVEMAHNLHRDYEKGADKLSPGLRKLIERGRTVPAIDYTRALAGAAPLNAILDATFDEYDAILTPAAPGEAPRGLDSTGNPVFCSLWTYLGTPAVTLPLLQGESGMPLGVQLVARRGNDARLLRTASWLVKAIEKGGPRRSRSPAAKDETRRSTKRKAR
jgi:Asp-tRNA(Asn)/Glu-tRNA(Gln) amidotransferase A subunit family amidase